MGFGTKLLTTVKQLFEPKVLSERWFKVKSKEEIMQFRSVLSNRLMDPNTDYDLRVKIRDCWLLLIDKKLREK